MAQNKRIISYITWVLYTALTGALVYRAASIYFPDWQGTLIACGITLVASVGLAFLCFYLGNKFDRDKKPSALVVSLLETFALMCILTGGLIIRFMQISDHLEPSLYYELSVVTEAKDAIAYLLQPMEVAYIWILNKIFFFVGNQMIAGFVLQIVLQMAALFVLYFVLRSLYGVISAILVFALCMFSDYFVTQSLTLSPDVLWLLLITLILLGASALVIRLKWFGIGIVWLAGLLLGVGRIVWTWTHGIGFTDSLLSFLNALKEGILSTYSLYLSESLYYELAVAAALMSLAITAIYFRRQEKLTATVLGFVLPGYLIMCASVTCGLSTELCIMITIAFLAASGLGMLFHKSGRNISSEEEFYELPSEEALIAEALAEHEEEPVVELIENPLPIPVKKQRGAADYDRIKEVDSFEFDLEISDDDDFDL